MNYLLEINAFASRMRRAPLSVPAQLLWYKLMDLDNSLFWEPEFQMDTKRLAELLGASSHTALAARNELVEAGLLSFRPGVKGKPSYYRLHSIEAEEFAHTFRNADPDPPEDFLCEVKEDITTYFGFTQELGAELREITAKLFAEFLPSKEPTPYDERRVFFAIKEQEQGENGDWTMTFPEEKKRLLAYAFEEARARGALNWRYIQGILNRLSARGIKSVDEAFDYEAEHQNYN